MTLKNTSNISDDNVQNLLQKFYSSYSIETTPGLDKKIDSYKSILPKYATVMIASPNNTNFEEIIRTAKRLRNEGMQPVPHIVARSIPSLAHLEKLLEELHSEVEIDHILVIAGDVATPVGPFQNSMDLLESAVFEKHGINKIGVSGHPEGSPYVSDKVLFDAIHWKNEFAAQFNGEVYICTQFAFEAAPIISWEQKIREQGNRLPIKVGIPGIATFKTLMQFAVASGIGQSIHFLAQQAQHIKQMLAHHTPQMLINDLVFYCIQDSSNLIESIHFFPFGGIEKTSDWINRQLNFNTLKK